MRLQTQQKPRGVVAMLSIFVFMAILLSIATSVAIMGQDQIVLAGVYADGEQAFSVADACAEEGYIRLKQDSAFTGASFPLDAGACVLTVTNLGGNVRLVRGVGTYRDSIRVVEVNVTIKFNNGGNAKKITINSWKEAN